MTVLLQPDNLRLRPIHNRAATRSPFTGKSQIQVAPNEWWEAELSYEDLDEAQSAQVRAFFLKQKGRTGSFTLPLQHRNLGTMSGTPTVAGSSQKRSRKLTTSGWNSNAQGVLLYGDIIQLSDYFYMVTGTVNTDSGGQATVPIWPRLRTNEATGTVLILEDLSGKFRLKQDTTEYQLNLDMQSSMNYTLVEAL